MGQIYDRVGERGAPSLVIMRPAELVISDLISLRFEDVPEAVILGRFAFETSVFEVEPHRMGRRLHIFACEPTRFPTPRFSRVILGIPPIRAGLREDIAKHF